MENVSIKIKEGTRTETLTLAKHLKADKWVSIVKTIPKGTKVEVIIDTINFKDYYRVIHPSGLGTQIMADVTFFENTNKKANVKVGDKFWFFSIYNYKMWCSELIKITPKFAYFNMEKENFRVNLLELESELTIDISTESHIGDRVKISKNKIDIQNLCLESIRDLKISREREIEKLAQEHTWTIEKYQKLEKEETELIKQIKEESKK